MSHYIENLCAKMSNTSCPVKIMICEGDFFDKKCIEVYYHLRIIAFCIGDDT